MGAQLTKNDKRTSYVAELSAKNIGERVCLMGWVQRQRDLGGLIFIDLRDRSGIVQLAFDDNTDKAVFDTAFTLRSEYSICAKGVVRARGEGAINKNIPTGEIEIAVDELKVFSVSQTPPFEIVENSDVKPELRLKHRYLDLRRPDLANNIIARSKIAKIMRDYYAENGFLEIETPCLIKPTPEGARDYLVPSRVHPGKFYALPQSPQLYKQLLMLSGFDRYMQLARCFRDEDLRADRQPEFTQIDLEMSYVTEDDVMEINEKFVVRLFKEFLGVDLSTPFLRMTYAEAMDRFGSDKPDMRFGYELQDISDVLAGCGFKVFADTIANGGSVRAIVINGEAAKFSRKEIDSLTNFVKSYRAKGLAWYKNVNGEVSSSYAKFLTDDENAAVLNKLGAGENDIIFIVADKNSVVYDSLGALRCEVAKRLGILKSDDYKFLWVTEFPQFEYDEDEGRYYAKHHPFTMPIEEDLEKYADTIPQRFVQRRMTSYSTVTSLAAARFVSTMRKYSRRCSTFSALPRKKLTKSSASCSKLSSTVCRPTQVWHSDSTDSVCWFSDLTTSVTLSHSRRCRMRPSL